MCTLEASQTKRIELDYAPDIPGLSFRRFRGEADYPNIWKIIDGSKEADGSERSETVEDIARSYAHLYNCDPYRDMLFAEVNNETVGYSRVWWMIQGDGTWIGFQLCFLLPRWRRKGIGTAVMRFNEERLREIALELIETGKMPASTPCFYDGAVAETETGRDALFRKSGYDAIRYAFNMVRPDLENIPEAPMPPGLTVRTPQPDEYRKVWAASNEAFQDHWGFIPDPEEEWLKFQEEPFFDPTLWRVAWDGEEVAGMVLSFINQNENEEYKRKRGYTENICVRRPYRRKGLASSLLVQSLHALKERGMEEAALGVDAENLTGALHLYESVGFKVVKRQTIFRKPVLVDAAGSK